MNNRIRILATSDVHGTIYPYQYSDGMNAYQGLSRLNTLISSLRDENTLLLDNGDILEGSPLSFYHYNYHPDDVSPMTSVMHDMKYDYVNVGNHDFDYGEECLMMHLQNVGAPCITSNWFFHGKPYGPTYVIREIAGKKVALFGLTTQYIPHWETKRTIAHSRFKDAYETALKTVDILKRLEKPDYIICLYHGGFERDQYGYLVDADTGENEAYRMLSSIHDIDVLITGHTHMSICGSKYGTAFTQTKSNGEELACIDIYTDTGVIEPRVLKADTEPDEEITRSADEEEKKCQTWLDQPLGTSKVDLAIHDEMDARVHKSQLVTFVNMVEQEATHADLAASSIFLHANGFGKEITMRDLVSTYVYPNTLVVKKITGKVLRDYLEQDANFFTIKGTEISVAADYDYPRPKHYNYDMIDGVNYTIKVSNPRGQRITELTYHGEPVTDDMTFTIALNNYRAGGGGNFEMLRTAPSVSVNLTPMVDLIAAWIEEHKVIDFEPVNNITVEM